MIWMIKNSGGGGGQGGLICLGGELLKVGRRAAGVM